MSNQTTEVTSEDALAKAPLATVVRPAPKLTAKGKPDLRGTAAVRISYTVGNLSVAVDARTHTMSAADVHDAIKRQIVWRDTEGRRVRYGTTPFRKGYFLTHPENTDANAMKALEYPKDVHAALDQALQLTQETHDRWPVVLLADNGQFYVPEEVDAATVKPFLLQDDKEEAIELLEKTSEIAITEQDLRPSVTYDQWLVERVKEIFAVGPDVPGLWKICDDMQRRDAVSVVQSWVERKGLTEYHMIVKANHIAEEGVFNLLGAVVTKPLQFQWLMPVPGSQEEIKARAAGKKVRLLTGQI